MNNQLYQASLAALTENGVPQDIAEKASAVVAKDEPGLPNLGRTAEDQQAVNEAIALLDLGEGE
ncbi:MAG: hypothetical protein RMX63_34550 [Aulosira sp. ZfuCHP01]|nr:hypothetical protein [Aulosira sp. ZfuVER01]MDZ8002345.1 hypothetical protein [Aulosira sp. DedVER01a]MDZ8056547.1 hypothetical protein [Aulosira sp. ZfuCHP01]